MVGHWPTMAVAGSRELAFESGAPEKRLALVRKAVSAQLTNPDTNTWSMGRVVFVLCVLSVCGGEGCCVCVCVCLCVWVELNSYQVKGRIRRIGNMFQT